MTGRGQSILLAELIEEVDDLPEPLEVQLGEIGLAWSRRESLRLAVVGPAHGNGRVGAIGKTQDHIGIDAAADADDLTSLAMQRMMGMGDGHRFQRRLGYRCSVLWVFQSCLTGLYKKPFG